MKKALSILSAGLLALSSCNEVSNIILPTDGMPTEEEVVEGLKTALEIGTDSASAQLSIRDGYYKDMAVKILLPEEAQTIRENIKDLSLVYDFEGKFESVEEGINHAAEDAATEAKPIFVNAITDLSITDGISILQGKNPAGTKSGNEESFDSLAATNYLKVKTFDRLVEVFSEPINNALDNNKIAGVSVNDVWFKTTSTYNTAAETYNSFAAITNQAEKPIVSTDIGTYCTEQALEGLFFKVGQQEKSIRQNPYKWATDIIEKVFGWVFE